MLQDGTTAVVMAARKGHIEALIVLLEAGADPTKADKASSPKLCTHAHTHIDVFCTNANTVDMVGGRGG